MPKDPQQEERVRSGGTWCHKFRTWRNWYLRKHKKDSSESTSIEIEKDSENSLWFEIFKSKVNESTLPRVGDSNPREGSTLHSRKEVAMSQLRPFRTVYLEVSTWLSYDPMACFGGTFGKYLVSERVDLEVELYTVLV